MTHKNAEKFNKISSENSLSDSSIKTLYLEYNSQTDSYLPQCECSRKLAILAKRDRLNDSHINLLISIGFKTKIDFDSYTRKETEWDYENFKIWKCDDRQIFLGQFKDRLGIQKGEILESYSKTMHELFMRMTSIITEKGNPLITSTIK